MRGSSNARVILDLPWALVFRAPRYEDGGCNPVARTNPRRVGGVGLGAVPVYDGSDGAAWVVCCGLGAARCVYIGPGHRP
ncbi:hypothetical protein GCM10023321_66540 [Pseudonocardia eucalypti]|uniref:Uncharacterized protein n=1 Tax=Pseudonocardia eucalypti TaxID=648755 RepID=A0ABP9R0R8_9PSEU